MKPQYRLITCDLDETLLNTEKKVPAANVEAIAAARKEHRLDEYEISNRFRMSWNMSSMDFR